MGSSTTLQHWKHTALTDSCSLQASASKPLEGFCVPSASAVTQLDIRLLTLILHSAPSAKLDEWPAANILFYCFEHLKTLNLGTEHLRRPRHSLLFPLSTHSAATLTLNLSVKHSGRLDFIARPFLRTSTALCVQRTPSHHLAKIFDLATQQKSYSETVHLRGISP